MKFKLAALLVAAALSLSFATGCSDGGNKKEPGEAAEEKAKPNEVLEKMLASIQNGETDKLPSFFSKELPAKTVTHFVEQLKTSREVLQFAVKKPVVNGKTATVDYLYFYQNKKKVEGGSYEPFGRRIKTNFTAVLNKEGSEWKVRKFDPALDASVERALFMSCLEQVSIAQLAEEQYFMSNRVFTRSVADMSRYLKVDLDACSAIDITDVEPDDYEIKAVTKNIPPCAIKATRHTIAPRSISGCEKPKEPAAVPARAAEIHAATVTIAE